MSAERPASESRTESTPTPTQQQPDPAQAQRDAIENGNRIRGLQAWMSDLERRLGIRTKLILLLAAIAIGASGAAIFLAVEANRTSASQEQLNQLEAEVELLEEQIETLAEELATRGGAAVDEPAAPEIERDAD